MRLSHFNHWALLYEKRNLFVGSALYNRSWWDIWTSAFAATIICTSIRLREKEGNKTPLGSKQEACVCSFQMYYIGYGCTYSLLQHTGCVSNAFIRGETCFFMQHCTANSERKRLTHEVVFSKSPHKYIQALEFLLSIMANVECIASIFQGKL